ncbi:MAG: hypothetical protein ACJ71Z_02960 [Aeromicrobium sp.]
MHRAVVVASCGALLVLVGCATPTQRAQLSAQSLTSDAREGARLAEQIVRGRAGPTFARTHAEELQDDVTRIENSIADTPTPDGAKLLRLGGELDRALGAIAIHPTDVSRARKSAKTLRQLSSKLARVAS